MVVDAGTLAVDGGGAGPGGQEGHHDGHAVQRDHHHDAGDDPGGRQVADTANTDHFERIDLLVDSHRTHLSGGARTDGRRQRDGGGTGHDEPDIEVRRREPGEGFDTDGRQLVVALHCHQGAGGHRQEADDNDGAADHGQSCDTQPHLRDQPQKLGSIPDAVVNYRTEILRLIAQMGLGVAALAMIGGTVVIVGFLTMTTGALIAVQGYNQLASVGIEALTGFASAYFNVRLIVPGTASVALSATIGAGATAQMGAMRINEEIDALEVIGIRSVSYLASTRVVAGIVVVIPLYCVAIMMAFLASRAGTTAIYGQGSGVYDHYFNTFLSPRDLIWSFLQVVAITVVVMLVHTYYGYTASGGPAGVGEAVGRAVRTSMVVAAVEIVMITLAVYGQSGNFHLAG